MKRLIIILIYLLLILILSGCNDADLNTTDSSTCYYSELFFESTEECAAYLAGTENSSDKVLTTDKRLVTVYQPADIPENFNFDRIRLAGSYVTYYYTADENTRPEYTIDAESKATSDPQNSKSESSIKPSISPAEEQNQIQKEINELGREGYIKKYGLSEMDLEEIENISNTFLVAWSYRSSNGEALLQDSIEKLSLSEYPNMPGYYGYEVTYPGVDEVLAYRVFWADGKYCYDATVPASVFDEMYVSGQSRKSGGFLLGAEKKTFSTQELKLEEK